MIIRLNILIIVFFIHYSSISRGDDFCEVKNLLENQNLSNNCFDNQLLFSYINFETNKINLKYKYEKELNLKIPVIFYFEIYNFIEKNCRKTNTLRIKEITNINVLGKKKYLTKIVVSCRFKL